jgi:hypothetical protein
MPARREPLRPEREMFTPTLRRPQILTHYLINDSEYIVLPVRICVVYRSDIDHHLIIWPALTVGADNNKEASMKSITIRKAGSVRLTGVAHPLYGGSCGPIRVA